MKLLQGRQNRPVGLLVEDADADPGDVRHVVINRRRAVLGEEEAIAELVIMNRPNAKPQRLAILTLLSFYHAFDDGDPSASTDLQKLLERLTAEGIDGLVLDLRRCDSGLL